MTPYEAAMKRMNLQTSIDAALMLMWIFAEEGKYEAAMHQQFEYLRMRDEWLNLWMSEDAEGVYWDMVFAAGGSYD